MSVVTGQKHTKPLNFIGVTTRDDSHREAYRCLVDCWSKGFEYEQAKSLLLEEFGIYVNPHQYRSFIWILDIQCEMDLMQEEYGESDQSEAC